MSDLPESSTQPAKRKTKKLKKSFNLLDFVVVKQKRKKTKLTNAVKVSKQFQRCGKVRKRKITTIKKRIMKARQRKVSVASELCDIAEEAEDDESEDLLIDKVAQIELSEIPIPEDALLLTLNSKLHATAPPFIPSKLLNSPVKAKIPQSCSTIMNNSASRRRSSSPPEAVPVTAIHSRSFREYCNHFVTHEIKHLTELVLKDLFKFQENKFQQNPVKAKANKRYVVGFKEVRKFLIVKRLKLIIIAPDLEKNAEVETLVEEIKVLADQHKIPCVFSIKRRHIGFLLLKKVPVSLVGIFDYQGTGESVNELLKLVKEQRAIYKNKTVAAS